MLDEFIRKYSYDLPEGLIRKNPLQTRHESKLFVYDTKADTVTHDNFINLDKYLPKGSKLILNQTKVLPVRLRLVGARGGKFEIFLVLNEWSGVGDVACFTNRKISNTRSKEKAKTVFLEDDRSVHIELYKAGDGITYMKNDHPNLLEFLDIHGDTPVPGYLEDNTTVRNEKYLRERYQTIFAKSGRSVAAPTASLHFTSEVFEKLHKKNIEEMFVTLDIGRGTFAHLREENLINKKLHLEKYSIPEDVQKVLDDEVINKVMVGTTVCRTVESYGATGETSGETDIFITEGFEFKYTNTLVTNFHLPESSLVVLVDAFLKHKGSKKNILDLYKIAIENNYTFYSFGDSMFIL